MPPFRPSRCYGRGSYSLDPPIMRVFRWLALAAPLLFAVPAQAHPHVWVSMKSEVVYDGHGMATAVRHVWSFDDGFSASALLGVDHKKQGKYTREELAPLAALNVETMKDYDYFTIAHADGKPADFKAPVDYWLDYTDGVLTLHFTLPLAAPVKAKALQVEMYDPSWFVDFSFAEKEPARLVGAPASCKLAVARPGEGPAPAQSRLGEAFFQNLAPGSNFGEQFSSKMTVTCP